MEAGGYHPPSDEEDCGSVRCRADVVPLAIARGVPVADDRLDPGVAAPDYLAPR
jgi:hypothetical protein